MESRDLVFARFLIEVKNCLPRDLVPGKMEQWINNPDLLQEIFEEILNPELFFKETVNYACSFKQILLKTNCVLSDFALEECPPNKHSQIENVYFEALDPEKEKLTADNIEAVYKQKNVRPATPFELIYFGWKHPELQKKFFINTVGKKVNTDRCVPTLSYLDASNKLILTKFFYYTCFTTKHRCLVVYEKI